MFLYHRFNKIVCNRLHNGHICPTHSYLIDCEDHPEYTDCNKLLTGGVSHHPMIASD